MTCLETTFLIDLLRGNPAVKEFKSQLDMTESVLTVATPTVMEVWVGACLDFSEPQRQKTLKLLSSLKALPLDFRAAQEAGEIEAELERRGEMIQPEDVMIAAIARTHGETLVTRDAHYARIPGLKVLKY